MDEKYDDFREEEKRLIKFKVGHSTMQRQIKF